MKTKPPVYEAIVINRVSNGYLLVDNTGEAPVCTVHKDLGEVMAFARLILDRVEAPAPAEAGQGRLSASEFERLYEEDLGSNVRSIRGPRGPREIPTDDHPST